MHINILNHWGAIMAKHKSSIIYLTLTLLTLLLISVIAIHLFNANNLYKDYRWISPNYLLVSNDDSIYFVVFGKDKRHEYLLNYNIKTNRTKLVYKTNGHLSNLSLSNDSSHLLFVEMKKKPDTVSAIIFNVNQDKIDDIIDISDKGIHLAVFCSNDANDIFIISNEGHKHGSYCRLYKYSISDGGYHHVRNISCENGHLTLSNNWCVTPNNKNLYISIVKNNEQKIIKYTLEELKDNIEMSRQITKDDISWINCSESGFILFNPLDRDADIMMYEDANKKKVIDNIWGDVIFMKLSPDGKLLSIKKTISQINDINATITEWDKKANSLYILSAYNIIYKYELEDETLKPIYVLRK